MDKSKELACNIRLVNEKLKFSGTVTGNDPVSIDYIPPFGDNEGYTSLELLLLSLSSCLGSAVLLFLRRMGKNISGFEISSKGIRRTEHPTGFSKIIMEIDIISGNTNKDDLDKVIKMAEDKYCPVWAMIRGNVETEVRHTIRND